MSLDFLHKLNDPQQTVVKTTEGTVLVLSGAGTGKTTSITSRIAYILSNNLAFPHQILAVTFTNKAAREMQDRIRKLINIDGIWVGTFHSVATKILRLYSEAIDIRKDFNIIDIDDQLRLIKNIQDIQNVDPKKYSPKTILTIINSWKDKALTPENLDQSLVNNEWTKIAAQIYKIYQQQLKLSNVLDFGDLLLYNIELFKQHPDILARFQDKFKYIHVDEYQDTNKIQDLWIKLLAGKHQNICCVGDDDQSIYGWRGAEISNILDFPKFYPDTIIIKLEQNYRSTKNILAAAAEIINKNKNRYAKQLWTDGELGEKIYLTNLRNDHEEAEFICKTIQHLKYQGDSLNDVAILVRASHQTRVIEDKLIKNILPFIVIGSMKFYDRLEIKDAIAYIRLANNPADNLAFERVINTPKRGIGHSTLKQIQNYSLLYNIGFVEAVNQMIKKQILTGKISRTLESFLTNLYQWQQDIKQANNSIVVENILKQSGYLDLWQNDPSIEAKGRVENLKELFRAVQDFENISSFLEHISLVTDNDQNNNDEKVKIMTLHASKGLEFNSVFLPGWEEGIFPSIKYNENTTQELEEERRLAYVGITRAKKRLFLSFCNERWMYNSIQYKHPSPFIDEIPKAIVKITRYEDIYSPNFLKNNDDISLKSSNNDSSSKKTGKKVFHQKFGYGQVITLYDNKADIYFEHSGLKKIGIEFVEFC